MNLIEKKDVHCTLYPNRFRNHLKKRSKQSIIDAIKQSIAIKKIRIKNHLYSPIYSVQIGVQFINQIELFQNVL